MKDKTLAKYVFLVTTQLLIIVVILAAVSIILATVLTNNTAISLSEKENNYKGIPVDDTLELVHVVFRHGDRTPEPGALYYLDPYRNYSFYPENWGELTNKGRFKAYELAKFLRNRYNEFLGSKFYSNIVKSFASGYDRTQMTLQCIHAGLFPNKESVLGIPWRPITYAVFDFEEDNRIGIMAHCRPLKFTDMKPTDEETIKLFEYLSEKSGNKMETYFDVITVTYAFHVETAYGLELPDWGKPLYPEPLETIHNQGIEKFAELNIRLGAGGLLKMISQFSRQKTEYHQFNRKLYLYSGHDYNLYFLLYSLKVWDHQTSDYCSFLMFELHRINGVKGFKIFYHNYKNNDPRLLKIPFCVDDKNDGSFCPLDTFIANTLWFYEPQAVCGTY